MIFCASHKLRRKKKGLSVTRHPQPTQTLSLMHTRTQTHPYLPTGPLPYILYTPRRSSKQGARRGQAGAMEGRSWQGSSTPRLLNICNSGLLISISCRRPSLRTHARASFAVTNRNLLNNSFRLFDCSNMGRMLGVSVPTV